MEHVLSTIANYAKEYAEKVLKKVHKLASSEVNRPAKVLKKVHNLASCEVNRPATFSQLKEMYNKKRDCIVKDCVVIGRVVQEWSLDCTPTLKLSLSILLLDTNYKS